MFNSNEEASIYEQLLAAVGIEQQLCTRETVPPPNVSRVPETNYPTCCTADRNDIIIRDGAHICYQCGNTVDFNVYVFYEPYSKPSQPLGGGSSHFFERKRSYKSLTHFKEHLRRYMGSRFTDAKKNGKGKSIAEIAAELRGRIDVDDSNCYREMQRLLKQLKYRDMYKEIFVLIYELGGRRPYIDNKIFDKCVTDFMWLQSRFQRLKYVTGTVRKNMPSMYVLLDLLLKRHGHTPYYKFPYLKDDLLQQKVMELFEELDGKHELK